MVPSRAANFEAGLPGEKTNIDRGKECDCQGRTHNQHNRRRSIKKARARLDRRLNDMSSFLVHNASRSALYRNPWAHNMFRHAKFKIGPTGRKDSTSGGGALTGEIDGGSASKCPSIWTIGVTS